MAETSYWDRTWKTADRAAIASYADRIEITDDPMVRYLKERGAVRVCDAGCGCGIVSLRLAASGFSVSGFDVSAEAVALTRRLFSEKGYSVSGFKTADILSTGYADGTFDAVIARDVLDHMPIRDGAAAVTELLRIVRPGGCVLLTLDGTDEEYESEPHEVGSDGDYSYTDGKWKGMVFHPFSQDEIKRLTRGHDAAVLAISGNRYTVVLRKPQG